MECHQTTVLKISIGNLLFFLQVTSLDLQTRSSTRIIALAITLAEIPHMHGEKAVYICGRDLRVFLLLQASTRGQGRLNVFLVYYILTQSIEFFF